MWRPWKHDRPASRGGDHDLLDAALGVVQTQLIGQIADETAIDGRTMGILAFNGALLAADIAARGLLHRWWWTPLVGVLPATVLCLWSVFEKEANLGPLGTTFYRGYGHLPSVLGRKQLLADMGDAFEDNAGRIEWKIRRLRLALGILLGVLAAAAILITFDQRATIKTDGHHHPTAASSVSQGARASASPVGLATREPERRPQVGSGS